MRMIEEGDIVTVMYVDGGVLVDVIVRHRPGATGDLWYFEAKSGVVYAQNPTSTNFDTITKHPEEQ